MSPKKVLADMAVALVVVVGWVMGCLYAASLESTHWTKWFETYAWGAWWIGPVAAAGYLAAGAVVRSSQRLGADRPTRILLRVAILLSAAAFGLAVHAIRMLPNAPRGVHLSYHAQSGPDVALVTTTVLATTSVALFVALRARLGVRPMVQGWFGSRQ